MTAVVPAAGGDGAAAAATPTEGATTLSDAQRRWCIGAAVVVMGLASLGTALYQSQSAEVDPAASGELAPLETSSAGSAGPGAAALPDPSLGGIGMPSPDALAPLSLMPSGGLPGGIPTGGIPTGAGVPAYVSPAPSQPRIVDSPAAPAPLGGPLASPAAPPGASLPAAGAAAPATASGTGTAAQRRAGGPPGTTGTTGSRGVIEVPAGQAPPAGYQRVYPVSPRQQAAPSGTAQQRRTTPGTATTPGTGRSTTPNGTQRRTPSTTSDGTTPSGSSTTPSGSSTTPSGSSTTPRSQGGLLGGLGG